MYLFNASSNRVALLMFHDPGTGSYSIFFPDQGEWAELDILDVFHLLRSPIVLPDPKDDFMMIYRNFVAPILELRCQRLEEILRGIVHDRDRSDGDRR